MQITQEAKYQYLNRDDLTKEDKMRTIFSYRQAAVPYSEETEWDPISIGNVYRLVVGDIIDFVRGLGDGSTALIAGAGSARDILMLLILNQKLHISAYDAAPELMRLGEELLYPKTDQEAEKLWERITLLTGDENLRRFPNGYVKEVVKAYEEVRRTTDILREVMGGADAGDSLVKINTRPLSERIVGTPNNRRVDLQQGLHETFDYFFAGQYFDFILAMATLQHLSKVETKKYCYEAAHMLKPGGIFHFNVRVHQDPQLERGPIFTDTILGPDNPRFYTTFSLRELEEYHQELQDSLGDTFEVVLASGLEPHPDQNKPPFAEIRVVRKF